MKALMVGGGTGGHVYPAIAVAEAIQEQMIDSQILFVGSEDGIETKIVPRERFTLNTIKARGMLRKFTIRSITAPFLAITAVFEAIKIIKNFGPDVIVATGGFVSLPVIIAGYFRKVPVILLEPNVVPGITTRICKWLASRIVISFEASRKYFRFRKVYCLGIPVRKQITSAIKGIAIQNIGLRQDQKIVLIIGGSQGAASINKSILESLPELEKLNIQVLHISGQRDYDQVAKETVNTGSFYHLLPYMDNVWDGLASAELVVSRAGAAAISEIVSRGLPSIIIPFPFSSERHQDFNAKVLVDAGATVLIKDSELSGQRLAKEIKRVLDDRPLYLQMAAASKALGKPDAAREIVNMISNMLGMDLSVRKRKRKVVRERKAKN